MSLKLIILFMVSQSVYFDLSSAFQYPYDKAQLTTNYWYELGKRQLIQAKKLQFNNVKAKNVILFIGDGMSLSTITAARILKGQLQNQSGEDAALEFEKFPFVSLIKTYNVDRQVPDSAGTATAFLTGVKTNYYTIGVNANVDHKDTNCDAVLKNKVPSIFDWAIQAGKGTGIVTTTRITHATPSSGYAHVSNREMEYAVPDKMSPKCKDIARQLIEDEPGSKLNVILGGGRRGFISNKIQDFSSKKFGKRKDNVNLIDNWINLRRDDKSYAFVNSTRGLRSINYDKVDHLLGLFNYSHLSYDKERDQSLDGEPSLEEMTESAIRLLKKNRNGFVLLVEGGRIDHAHHDNYGVQALYETIAFEKAIKKALSLVSTDDTLVIVTSDHSHAFTINGYPLRGNPISGIVVPDHDIGQNPYTTLMYGNGPGYTNETLMREKVTRHNTADLRYQHQSAVNLTESAHAGEDVALYSIGPMSHLFHGTQEQSYIAHVISYASCIGHYQHEQHCHGKSSSNSNININIYTFTSQIIVLMFFNKLF